MNGHGRRALVLALMSALAACYRGAMGDGASDDERNHPLVGRAAPPTPDDLALPLLADHGAFELASVRGKVVIVEFWAAWCVPCAAAFPKLAALHTKYERDVAIVAVSEDDDRDGVSEFARTYGANFPVVWDERKRLAAKWRPRRIPATFVLDRAGIVRFVHIGYHDGEETEIEREVQVLLGRS